MELTQPFSGSDVTILVSDDFWSLSWFRKGDVCDEDKDNDGLEDSGELAGGDANGHCEDFGPTDPLKDDSDGDLMMDRLECILGSDPNDGFDTASFQIGFSDCDSDGLSDYIELLPSFDSAACQADTDGDGMSDLIEARWGALTMRSVYSSGSSCTDAKVMTSFNGDLVVNIADRGMLAVIISEPGNSYDHFDEMRRNFDVNRDGTHNIADTGLVSQNFGTCS